MRFPVGVPQGALRFWVREGLAREGAHVAGARDPRRALSESVKSVHQARAKVRQCTLRPPASRIASHAANSVAPVVHTSSMSRMLFGALAPGRADTACAMFPMRARRESARWSRARGGESRGMTGRPITSATSCASSSAWSNPRRARALREAGTNVAPATSLVISGGGGSVPCSAPSPLQVVARPRPCRRRRCAVCSRQVRRDSRGSRTPRLLAPLRQASRGCTRCTAYAPRERRRWGMHAKGR